MNVLIIVLIVIASIIALFLIVALFTRKGYTVERETVINRPKQEVFNYIRHLRNQDQFSKWVMMDPAMKKTFTGTDGAVGFVYAWEGNKKAGKGEQEIIGIKEGERLNVEVRFVKPFEAIAQTPFVTEAVSANQTKLKWGMTSTMKYPMNGMLLFMNMDKLLGKDLEISLGNLKGILEKQ